MQPGHLNKADQQSNEDAVLYDRYGFTIFSYVRLHTASREDAEDLTLEVFAAALERDNLRALSEQEQLAWLRRVAHNKLVDGYRRVSRHTLVAFDKVEKVLEEYGASNPEYLLLQQEEYTHLRKMVSRLSTLQQQVLHLRFSAELSFAEIALLLNKREDAVRKVLSRTLASLRASYSDQQQ